MNVLVTITDGDTYREAWVDSRDAARIVKMMERCGFTVREMNGRGDMVPVDACDLCNDGADWRTCKHL